MKRIEFGELRIGHIARRHLDEVCKNNWASMGVKVKQFEEEWSNIFDYKHSVAVSSGTDAVLNACLALYDFGANRGDEIIVPALGFIATSNAVRAAGFKPVFVDVRLEDMNINVLEIPQKITNKTRAIIAVHTMGQMCDMDTLKDYAKQYNLCIIEDSAEAHGAKRGGKVTGHWGDMACFSYYVAHLICAAEGGMVSTNNDKMAAVLRSTRSHGRNNADLYFDHIRTGLNSKMNDLEASLGLEGVVHFWDTFFTRSRNMLSMLKSLPDFSTGLGYFVDKRYVSSYSEYHSTPTVNCPHGFSVVVRKTTDGPMFRIEDLEDALDEANIHWKRNFGCIPTQHLAFKDMGYKLGDFPNSEWIGDHGLHIGCHQYLTYEDIERITNVLHDFFSERIN